MLYISEYHAVNIDHPNEESAVDWHGTAYDWDNPPMLESEESVFGDFGIDEIEFSIDGRTYRAPVATHLRACLDMLERGHHVAAQGMRDNFLGNEELTPLLFEKVAMLRESEHWPAIDKLMGREYLMSWLEFKENDYAL